MFPIGPFWVNNYVQIANFWLGATLLHYTAADENYQRWERERERENIGRQTSNKKYVPVVFVI